MNDVGQEHALIRVATRIGATPSIGAAGRNLAQQYVQFVDQGDRVEAPGSTHLLGRRGPAEEGVFESLWTLQADGVAEDPRHVFTWMWSRPELWSFWGRSVRASDRRS